MRRSILCASICLLKERCGYERGKSEEIPYGAAMGSVLIVAATPEIILDPEADLRDLIERYIGTDAAILYSEIIRKYENQLKILTEDNDDKEREVSMMEDTIDDCRYEISMVLKDLNEEVDLAEVRRRLDNIYWELGY